MAISIKITSYDTRFSANLLTGYERSAYLFHKAFAVELVAAGERVECLRHQRECTTGTFVLRLDERVSGKENMSSHLHEGGGDTEIVELHRLMQTKIDIIQITTECLQ